MKRSVYDKQLIKWVKGHYWDSLEKDKELILRHLRTFAGDETPGTSQPVIEADAKSRHNFRSCGVVDHPDGAEYCYQCGTYLHQIRQGS